MDEIREKLMFWIYKQDTRIKLRVFYFPILLIIGFLLVKLEWNNVYTNIIQEDSYVENAQFAAYFTASILAFFAGFGCWKKGALLNSFCLLIFAFLLMFVSMEEIAWGQRLFSISTPAWFQQHNTQKEITIHNLKPFQHVLHQLYVLTGTLFAFWWIPAKYISSGRRLSRDLKNTVLLLSPGWYLMSFFVPVAMIYAYFLLPSVQIGYFVVWRDQEPAELLLALGFLLFVTAVIMRLKYGVMRLPAGGAARLWKEEGRVFGGRRCLPDAFCWRG